MVGSRHSHGVGRIAVAALLTFAAVVIAAAGAAGEAASTPGDTGGTLTTGRGPGAPLSTLGAANPAALYCAALGYAFEIERTRNGERGVCVLPSGARVDAWEFYRGKVGQEYSWCARNGYGIATETVNRGTWVSEYAVCLNERGEVIGPLSEVMGLDSTGAGGTAPRPSAERPERWGTGGSVGGRGARDLPSYFDWRDVDGCTSISSTGRYPPGDRLFRAIMLPQAVILALTWHFTVLWLKSVRPATRASATVLISGLLGALALGSALGRWLG